MSSALTRSCPPPGLTPYTRFHRSASTLLYRHGAARSQYQTSRSPRWIRTSRPTARRSEVQPGTLMLDPPSHRSQESRLYFVKSASRDSRQLSCQNHREEHRAVIRKMTC
jgi:hypothetical protein